MTLVKSLHSGDPGVTVIHGLASADVLAAGRCFADALQVLFGLHPSVVHVCSCMFNVHVTHALGGALRMEVTLDKSLQTFIKGRGKEIYSKFHLLSPLKVPRHLIH
jgi:hypothetical protein